MNATLKNQGWWAGIALAVGVSLVAGPAADFIGHSLLGFERSPVSEIMMAIVIGMLIANVFSLPTQFGVGLKFCASTVLRVGIMLLGIRLSLFGAGKFTLVALPFVVIGHRDWSRDDPSSRPVDRAIAAAQRFDRCRDQHLRCHGDRRHRAAH